MIFAATLSRIADYNRRHGMLATIRRVGVATRRAVFSGRSVLFYCDLAKLTSPRRALPDFLSVERKESSSEISPEDWEAMTSFWNPKLARQNMKERFDRGASLWLIKSKDVLAGFGWTLQGGTIEPHYFPLGENDVQFLDFHVFPKFRGRGIDWVLMTQILDRLAAEGLGRAYGEAGEWNRASLASFKMSPFRLLGTAKKRTLLGRTVVCWSQNEIREKVPS